jgi:hypothetical protein
MGKPFIAGDGRVYDSEMFPTTGRHRDIYGVFNIVEILKQGRDIQPVNDTLYDIDKYVPKSGILIGEDGRAYSLRTLLDGYVPGSGGGTKQVYTFDHQPTSEELAALPKPFIYIVNAASDDTTQEG